MTTPIVFLMGCLLVKYTGMYMFDLNLHYNWPIVAAIVAAIVVQTEDQTCTCQCIIQMGNLSKYGWRGHESPSGYRA